MDIDPECVPLATAHRIGPYNAKSYRPRPLIIKFVDFASREKVWSKRRSLQGGTIWLNEDFPVEIDRRRKMLWPFVLGARQGDPDHPDVRITANLHMDKIIINKQAYTVNDIDKLPEFAKRKVHHKKTKDVTIFFSRESPFSNFYRSIFEIEEQRYTSVEQYLSYNKAIIFDEPDLATELLHIDEPKILKQKVKRLRKYDEDIWIDRAPALLKSALAAKFEQDDDLKQALVETGSTVLGEASPSDFFFGIGMSLNRHRAVDRSSWTGENLQGRTLMWVRDEIND